MDIKTIIAELEKVYKLPEYKDSEDLDLAIQFLEVFKDKEYQKAAKGKKGYWQTFLEGKHNLTISDGHGNKKGCNTIYPVEIKIKLSEDDPEVPVSDCEDDLLIPIPEPGEGDAKPIDIENMPSKEWWDWYTSSTLTAKIYEQASNFVVICKKLDRIIELLGVNEHFSENSVRINAICKEKNPCVIYYNCEGVWADDEIVYKSPNPAKLRNFMAELKAKCKLLNKREGEQ